MPPAPTYLPREGPHRQPGRGSALPPPVPQRPRAAGGAARGAGGGRGGAERGTAGAASPVRPPPPCQGRSRLPAPPAPGAAVRAELPPFPGSGGPAVRDESHRLVPELGGGRARPGHVQRCRAPRRERGGRVRAGRGRGRRERLLPLGARRGWPGLGPSPSRRSRRRVELRVPVCCCPGTEPARRAVKTTESRPGVIQGTAENIPNKNASPFLSPLFPLLLFVPLLPHPVLPPFPFPPFFFSPPYFSVINFIQDGYRWKAAVEGFVLFSLQKFQNILDDDRHVPTGIDYWFSQMCKNQQSRHPVLFG